MWEITNWNDRFVKFIRPLEKWGKTTKNSLLSIRERECECNVYLWCNYPRQTMYKLTPSQIQFLNFNWARWKVWGKKIKRKTERKMIKSGCAKLKWKRKNAWIFICNPSFIWSATTDSKVSPVPPNEIYGGNVTVEQYASWLSRSPINIKYIFSLLSISFFLSSELNAICF